MTDTPLATAADLAEIWRPLSDAETAQADKLCIRASALLRSRLRTIDQRIQLDPTDPASLNALVVAGVVAGMVKRVMKNPDGLMNRSKTSGPYSESVTYAGSRSSNATTEETRGELEVTDGDIAKLTPQPTRNKPGSIKVKAGLAPPTETLLPLGAATDVYFEGWSGEYPNYGDGAP